MNHFISAIVLTASAATALGAVPIDTLRLSRHECIAIALSDNQSVKVADLEVKRMDYSKKEVLASLFPSIDFQGTYQRSIELQSMSMNMGGHTQQIKMGTDNNWNFGFNAQMPVVNAQLWKSISISDVQILQALENARSSRLDLVNNINKAYYALLLAIDSREVLQQNYDLAKFNHELYQKQFEQGTASEYDVLRSSVQVTNVEPDLLQADISVKQCALQLVVLMGLSPEVTVRPDIRLADLKNEMTLHNLPVDRSLAGNTSLRQLDINRNLAAKNLTLQKLAWVPTLAVQYNINWNAMSNGNAFRHQTFNPYSNVALALQVPIFSGGSKMQKVRQAGIQVKELELQRENLVNSLKMQIDLAVDNITRQSRQIDSSEKGMQQAAKALEIMQRSFEIGAATYLNLRDSEIANTSAQLAYYQAIYNYLVSLSELDALLGREDALGFPAKATK